MQSRRFPRDIYLENFHVIKNDLANNTFSYYSFKIVFYSAERKSKLSSEFNNGNQMDLRIVL
jgi:hypothetical protein